MVVLLPGSLGLFLLEFSKDTESPRVGESRPARSVASVLYLGKAVLLSGDVLRDESRESVEDKGKPVMRAAVFRLFAAFSCPVNGLGATFMA